nr:cytochrome b6-f complex subunit 6 [Anemia phyllitidis]UUL71092.1 cytochrome b6-f complex subunit 6 [Anemia phyllitidis]
MTTLISYFAFLLSVSLLTLSLYIGLNKIQLL